MIQEAFDTARSVIIQTRTYLVRKHLLDGPIRAFRLLPLPEDAALNHANLILRHSLGQTTQFKVAVDVLTRRGGTTVYRQLRKCSATVACPTPEQAELAIEAILAFAQSLDGKWLAPNPTDQVVGSESHVDDSKMLRYYSPDRSESGETSAGNPQAIGAASAGNSSAEAGKSTAQEPSCLTAQQDSGNGENP